MKLLTLIAPLLMCATAINAQKNIEVYSIYGSVSTATGEPLAGASVYIADLKKGTITDEDGRYKIENIPNGTYLLEVNFSGFKSVIERYYFNKDIEAHFNLTISVTEEKEIVITGSSRATSLKRNPVPIVSIGKQQLKQNLNTNIIDAIASVPGINAVTTGPNVSKPFIRGLGFNRVLTLYDGIRQEGQQWGNEHGVEIDENVVERVEVVKGPASLLYGSDAIAGVVNLIPANAPPFGTVRAHVSNEYQTNNKLVENSAQVEGYTGTTSWGAVVTHKMAADYQNKYDGRVYNTGFDETSVNLQAALHKNWGYSRFGASMYSSLQEIPDGRRDSASRKFEKLISEDEDLWQIVSQKELNSYAISNVHQHIQHYRIYNVSNFIVGRDRAAVQLGFQRNIRKEFEDPEMGAPALFLELNTLTYDAKYFFHEAGSVSVTAGLNGMFQQNKVENGHEFIIPSYRQFDAGPFVYLKKSAGKMEIAGGLRYDFRNFENKELYVAANAEGLEVPVFGKDTIGAEKLFSNYSYTFSGMSGSIGLSYRFNSHWNAKFNLGRGYRAPNISEISANGVHAGSKIYQLGNNNFKPEFSLQQDLGVTFTSEHVTINAEVFHNHIQNYIYNKKVLTENGEDSIIVAGNETFQFAASGARLLGGELFIDIHPHPLDWLHFENSVSFVSARNLGKSGGEKVGAQEKYLPFIPPFHTKSELRANFHNIGNRLKNNFVKVQMEMFAAQNKVFSLNNTETPTAGYELFHAGLGTDFCDKKGNVLFTFSVLANNIFDKAYQSHMSRLKYFEDFPDDPRGRKGVYNMGRNISVRLVIPVNLKG